MPRNIEIKARIAAVAALLPQVCALADQGPWEILQDDTYFRCATGRLKLRAFSAEAGELIYYRREHKAAARESHYLRSPTTAPDALRESLTLAYGELGRIHKRRTLFLRGRTRIHLDEVAALGEFLELEVVLAPEESPAAATLEAHELLSLLGIERAALLAGGYLDLLA